MPRAVKGKRKQKRAVNKKPAFLKAFKVTASLTEAARAVGIDRGLHYDWLRLDPKYAAAFEAAREQAAQTLHDSAVERSLKGVFEPLVYQGRFTYPQEQYEITPAIPASGDWKDEGGVKPEVPAVMGWRPVPGAAPLGIWRRSEALHLALLRAHIPAFRASNVELTGKDGGAIEISIADVLRERRARREGKDVCETKPENPKA